MSGNLGLSTITMHPEESFTYKVSRSTTSAEKAARDIMEQIKKNFTDTPKYCCLKVSAKACAFDTAEIWLFLEPLIKGFASNPCSPPLLLPYIWKEQSQKHLVVTFGRSDRHIGTRDLYADSMRYCIRPFGCKINKMFDVRTEVRINPRNTKQQQKADFAVILKKPIRRSAKNRPRLIVGEVMCSETVEHAMNKMMAQQFINQDITLFMLVFYIEHMDDSGKPDGKRYHVIQFYKPINTEGEAGGCRTTLDMEMGRTMTGQVYDKNRSGESTAFPGMDRGLEDGWDLCLLDQFVGLFDSNENTPVEMKVIGPMTEEALAQPLDLSKGSNDSKLAFSFNLAPYLINNCKVECNLNLRWTFANINMENPLWCFDSENEPDDSSSDSDESSNLSSSSERSSEFAGLHSAMRTEEVAIKDARDLKLLNLVLDTYNADVARSLQEEETSSDSGTSFDTDDEPETNDVSQYMKPKILEEEAEDQATAVSAVAEFEARAPGEAMKRIKEGRELSQTLRARKKRKV